MREQNPTDRIYTVQNDGYDFFTGTNKQGRQVLLGVAFPDYVAVEFDGQGNYLATVAKPISSRAFVKSNGIYHGNNDVLQQELGQFQEYIGFVPGTIHVKKFQLDDPFIGIDDYPSHLDLSDMPDDEYERAEAEAERQEWIANKQFVLWWGKDFFMSEDGEVDST